MDKTVYEKMLLNHCIKEEDAEKKWDARAEHFNMAQQKDNSGFAEKVITFLKERDILENAEVLDIGGGSGRYALPFAVNAQHVTVMDISTNMLKLAHNNAKRDGLTNLSYVKLDWAAADLLDLKWNKKFDITFASMCPAIHSNEGINKMSQASKGYCLINQFITDTDSLSDYLNNALDIQKSYHPHNNRNMVQAIFNILWLEGFEPEIKYIKQTKETSYTTEEAFKLYAGQFEVLAKNKGVELKSLISDYSTQDVFQVNRKITLAMILWKV